MCHVTVIDVDAFNDRETFLLTTGSTYKIDIHLIDDLDDLLETHHSFAKD